MDAESAKQGQSYQVEVDAPALDSNGPVMPPSTGVVVVPVEAIDEESQPSKRDLDPKVVESLKASIKNEGGLLHPLVVRLRPDKYQLIAGRHRLHAIRALGWTSVPVTLKEMDDEKALMASLAENARRKQLSGAQFKEVIQQLNKLNGEASLGRGRPRAGAAKRQRATKKVAEAAGVSETSVVRAKLREEKLVPDVKAALAEGKLKNSVADELATLNPDAQRRVLPVAIGKNRDEVRELIKSATRGIGPASTESDSQADGVGEAGIGEQDSQAGRENPIESPVANIRRLSRSSAPSSAFSSGTFREVPSCPRARARSRH
jgi:ParB family transcriptional regulator, chromosome partitioning protein